MTTSRELLKQGVLRLAQQPSARLEAELLLCMASGVSRAALFAHPEQTFSRAIEAEYARLLERRADGEPMAYILGQREFWSLNLRVTPAVLIPRPETELLVEAALERIPSNTPLRIADLGTGSGAVALAIAHERPNCQVQASDLSASALQVATENAERLGLENVCFREGSWLEPLDGLFDVIASNPPYIAGGDSHLDTGDLRFEPRTALEAGPDGLEAIRAIVPQAVTNLTEKGWLMFEHGHEQGTQCRRLLTEAGFERVETKLDLQGLERITLGRLAGRCQS